MRATTFLEVDTVDPRARETTRVSPENKLIL